MIMEQKNITIEWLRLEFYKCNHAKYRKYADEWLNNLTDAQIEGFERHARLYYFGIYRDSLCWCR